MADWNAPLPGEAEVGDSGHPEDHNKIVAAIREVQSNVDDIELTPGPEGPEGKRGPAGSDGSDAANPFTEDEVVALKALVADEG